MNGITIAGDASITSAEIAELVGKRHDNVKRTIETLAEQGVIVRPQIEDEPGIDAMGRVRPTQVYSFAGEQGKRDSIVVVAQLSPEFTARLVDRWQELEKRLSKPDPMAVLNDPAAMRGLLLSYADKVLALESTVEEQAPKVAALDRFADHNGKHTLRSAAKMIGIQEYRLKSWLLFNHWYYRDHSGRLCAYAERIAAGYLDTVSVEIQRTDGVQVIGQAVITQKGLTHLATRLARDGILPKVAVPA